MSCLEENNRTRLARSQSFLKPISPNRTCQEIGLSRHYCICQLDWHSADLNAPMTTLALEFTIGYMNKLISPASNYCVKLSLSEVTGAKVASTLVDGRLNETFYKIDFSTKPNNGKYSAVIKVASNSSFFIDSPSSISRTNAYGTQSKCLEQMRSTKAELLVDLRKFCICKSRVPKTFRNRLNRF